MKSSAVDHKLSQIIIQSRSFLQEKLNSTPCFIMLNHNDFHYPIYIDKLENGIELMLFPSEAAFVRSIINARGNDPDLLFTEAITINYLYHPIQSSKLPLIDKENLIFCNQLGSLPRELTNSEKLHTQTCMLHLMNSIKKLSFFPCIKEKKMLLIHSNSNYDIKEFHMPNNKNEYLSMQKNLIYPKLPHTNELLRFQFIILPTYDTFQTLNIHLYAFNKNYFKDQKMKVENITSFVEEIYSFFTQIMKERGLPECIIVSSLNLFQILSCFCKKYDIILKLLDYEDAYDEELLNIILQKINHPYSTTKLFN